MKKAFLPLLLCAVIAASSSAISLKDAFDEIQSLPDVKGVQQNRTHDIHDGWVNDLPVENALVLFKAHEAGNRQHMSKVEEVARQIPTDNLVISGVDYQNLFYMFARQIDQASYEVLILVDQAFQGQTQALYGKMNSFIVNAMKNGKVSFDDDNSIMVTLPLLVSDR